MGDKHCKASIHSPFSSLFLLWTFLWRSKAATTVSPPALQDLWAKADQTRLEQDAHLPEGFLKTLAKAATACDKLLKEGLKLSKERGLAEKEGALKAAYADLTKHQSQIEHVKTWKELPNTDGPLTKGALDNFLLDIARDVDKYNREIESVKGILKARRN